jgi:protoporphyrin/coproporphyrin ferrochelatase
MPQTNERVGVVLLQFGGPDSLDAVEPFLYNLFNDPAIVELPFSRFTQKRFAAKISKSRALEVREKYAELGGSSPIVKKTFEQQRALQTHLDTRFPGKTFVTVAMRYWKPFTETAVNELLANNIRKVVLLPLYAQYSKTNAGSSYVEWDRVTRAQKTSFEEERIISYHLNPKYIRALNERLDEALKRFPDPSKVHLLFSAHGTPLDMVMNGDPYARQITETIAALLALRSNDLPSTLAYQSRVGPKKWLSPYTTDTIKELGKQGVKEMLVVPISFVSDHIETLHELDEEERENAEHAGVEHYEVMEALNSHPLFIEMLGDLTAESIAKLEKAG